MEKKNPDPGTTLQSHRTLGKGHLPPNPVTASIAKCYRRLITKQSTAMLRKGCQRGPVSKGPGHGGVPESRAPLATGETLNRSTPAA